MSDPDASERRRVRSRIVEEAAGLLAASGRQAVTTRAVATAAGVQPPAIYRHFADMEALLDAVAERGYELFLESKKDAPTPDDPAQDLRVGWGLAVGFGLANPHMYALMYGEPRRSVTSAAHEIGLSVLVARVRRVAGAGRLRVSERIAITIISAMTRGAVLTWLSLPEEERDPVTLDELRESMIRTLVTEPSPTEIDSIGTAARALRAHLAGSSDSRRLTPGEHHVLGEWLDRLAEVGDGQSR